MQNFGFYKWLMKDHENRRLLPMCLVVMTIQFACLKFLYPFPNFMPPDSNSYIEAAYNNQFINIWAIGYSKFLRLFSCFTTSDFALVLFQYLLLEGCLLYFIFSLAYILSLSKWTLRILLISGVLNPILLHVSNFVSSDALFTALSVVWFTQLIWILHQPSRRILILNAFILLLSFSLRYNALYYPFVSIIVVIYAHLTVRAKWIGVSYIILLLGAFIGRTLYQYYKDTGTIQYSAFGGWQLAANALYGYAHAQPIGLQKVPSEFRALHSIVNQHMDSIRRLDKRADEETVVYYLWDEKSPLKSYSRYWWQHDTITNGLNRWITMGAIYAAYGRYLIQCCPGCFIKYYVWHNLANYYAPPVNFMGMYNLGRRTVDQRVASWFRWKDNIVYTRFKDANIAIAEYFPVLIAVSNLIFILSFVGIILIVGFRSTISYHNGVLTLIGIVWACNMLFSVLSAPIDIRYQIFPMVITLASIVLLVRCIFLASSYSLNEQNE